MPTPDEHAAAPGPSPGPDGAARLGTVSESEGQRPASRPGRALPRVTAVAVGLLALVYATDLIQVLLGLPFTVHDLSLAMGFSDTRGRAVAIEAPLNLVQTVVLTALSVAALLGGLACLGRRRGAARIGGALAILAVVLPLTIPLLFSPVSQLMRDSLYGSELQVNLLFRGFPALVSAAGLVPGLVAAPLLLGARPKDERLLGIAASVVGIVLSAVFVLEALAALLRQIGDTSSWWGIGWYGIFQMGPYGGLVLGLLLLVVMTAGGLGSGLLLGSSSLLTRIGGGVLAAALAVRVVTQAVSWGMGYYLQIRAARLFDYTWIWPIEWTNAIAVPVLAVMGILLAIIGLFTGPKRAPAAAVDTGVGPGAPATGADRSPRPGSQPTL